MTDTIYSEQDCIDALQRVTDQLGESPTYKQYQECDVLPAASTIKRIFGTWNDAKRAASVKQYAQTKYSVDDVPDRVPHTQAEWEEMTKDRRQVWRKRMYAEQEKLNRGCTRCGYDAFATPLSFHHTDPSEKYRSVSELVNNGKSYEKIDAEIEKCEVLCANCHMVEEYGR